MKKSLSTFVLAAFCCAPAFAQGANRISTFARETLAKSSKEITAAAAEMPADKYNFKAPPDDITFGYLLLHVADINYPLCSLIGGVLAPKLPQLNETDAKDVLIERMKASFEFCTTALANLDDSSMQETLDLGGAKMSRAMTILTLTGTWASHHDLQQKYLQLNGISQSPPAN
jgi:DinB family protein